MLRRAPVLTAAPLWVILATAVLWPGAVHAVDAFFEGVEIIGLDARYTSGTVLTQRMESGSARLAPNARALAANDVFLQLTPERRTGGADAETPQDITIHAPMAFFYFDAPAAAGTGRPVIPPVEEVAAFARLAPDAVPDPRRGDLFLFSGPGDGTVEVELAGRGSLQTARAFWSEEALVFLVLDRFVQQVQDETGALEIEGDLAVTDSGFQSWTYYSTGEIPGQIVYEEKSP